MGFERTYWIWIGLVILTIFIIYKLLVIYRTKNNILKVSDSQLFKEIDKKHKKYFNKELILLLFKISIILLLSFALARPFIFTNIPKNGINVIVVLDKSGTMQYAIDGLSRLDFAKQTANKIIDSLDPNDFVGLVELGNSIGVPLCLSKKDNIDFPTIVEEEIDQIDPPAAIGDGLYIAVNMGKTFTKGKSIIFLLSDGVNSRGFLSINDSIEAAIKNQIEINTIYFGEKEEVDFGYNLMDDEITPKMQHIPPGDDILFYIANKTNGVYRDFKNIDNMDEFFIDIEKDLKKEKEKKPYQECLLFIIFILFIINLILKEKWDVE